VLTVAEENVTQILFLKKCAKIYLTWVVLNLVQNIHGTICHKIGLSKVKDGSDMWTNSWSNFSSCLLGVDEQMVHIGVQMSQGPKVFGTQSP
jgi:hypothetical protein